MDIRAEVQRLTQEFLGSRDEDRAWLQGGKGTEWNDAYLRLLDYVSRRMMKQIGWREYLDVRVEVVQAVKEAIEQ